MLGHIPTTPFGRRTLSLAVVEAQRSAKACPEGKPAHKWQVFHDICETRAALTVSDRALAVLNALLSFHPDTVLTAGAADLVVFPSNRRLAARAHGIAPSTLRRHIAMLVESGLIIRRDSPNGKRFARKDREGQIEQAFGFDLSPIVSRAEEFAALAEAIRADARALDLARQRVTLCRRDIRKMIATGIENRVAAVWPRIHASFVAILDRIPRRADRAVLEPIAGELASIASDILAILESHTKSQKSGTTESRTERHIQNSNTETPLESEPALRESRAVVAGSYQQAQRYVEGSAPLGMVLEACPDMVDYARAGIRDWRDLISTASLVRSLLGISPSAWDEAREAMGETQASIAIAAILQRGAAIKSPGGYLRSLSNRARMNTFSVTPMLLALLSSQRRRCEWNLPSELPS
jgi:replication initiation protein RepC